ncbi:MAG: Nramp family divalent metal transporter [Rhizobiales bacterium]|nr:Nramp family divalent metal transporter [Hyphomicrobiales bacterium]
MSHEPVERRDAEAACAADGSGKPRLRDVLGPGLITGASDDDPSGIATYSQVGAQFGYSLGWSLVVTYPLMTAVQMISARIGRTTGKGIAGIMREHFPRWLLVAVVLPLLVANIINIGADLGAMADATRLIAGGPQLVYLVAFAVLSTALQVFMRYERYVALLKWLALVLLAYVATLMMVHIDWAEALYRLAVPELRFEQSYVVGLVAVLGTTISPYLFFWQASQEAADVKAMARRETLRSRPGQGAAALQRIRLDTMIGMGISNLIALAIVLTAAATLHGHGVSDIETSAQAAEALRPIAGAAAEFVFAAGIVGTGLLSIPVLAGSAAYAVAETFKWRIGLDRKPGDAKNFYAVIALATLLGAALNLSPLNPIQALYWSAVLNGVVAVPVLVVMMLIAARPAIMGRFTLTGWLRGLGWATTVVMALAVVGMVATAFRG